MKKVVRWDAPKISSSKLIKGGYRNFHDMFKKAVDRDNEQREADEYLKKAMPAMVALLEYKLSKSEPLIVMRPLVYQTSAVQSEEDDGFYNTSKSQNEKDIGKFIDVMRTISPGTQLMLKSLDTGLEEFVFIDGRGKEHAISYSDRDKLLTQTDIFEGVKSFLQVRNK